MTICSKISHPFANRVFHPQRDMIGTTQGQDAPIDFADADSIQKGERNWRDCEQHKGWHVQSGAHR